MAYLKGNTTSFIFEKNETEKLLKLILENNFVLYRGVVDSLSEQAPISNTNQLEMNDFHFYIVPNDKVEFVKWRTVKLVRGGENYHFDNLNSRAIQLLLSQQSQTRIGTGRIAISTEWEDDEGEICIATYEKEIYKLLKRFIRKLSVGTIGGLFIGNSAYTENFELCHDANNGALCFSKDKVKFFRKQK